MTPGQLADHALTLVNQASGDLGGMVIKKQLSRGALQAVADKLDSSLKLIKEILEGPRHD